MATPKTAAKTSPTKTKPAVAKAPAAKAAPAAKPAAAKAPATKTAAATKRADPPAKGKTARPVPPEQRRNYVEVAAYYIAERHGFTPGRELQDWAAAEAEIDRLLAEGLLKP